MISSVLKVIFIMIYVTPFTNEAGNDVLLDDRKMDYYSEYFNICQEGCNFLEYNSTTRIYLCECPIDNSQEKEIIKKHTHDNFYKNKHIQISKCSNAFRKYFLPKDKKIILDLMLFLFVYQVLLE